LANSYQGRVCFGKVNVDESGMVASKYGVMSIPTVVMFVDGKEVNRQVGFAGKEGYEAMIKKAIGG
jgi:thioredoxin 1